MATLFICPPVHEVPEAVLDLRHPRPVDGLQVLEASESLRHRVGHLDILSYFSICETLDCIPTFVSVPSRLSGGLTGVRCADLLRHGPDTHRSVDLRDILRRQLRAIVSRIPGQGFRNRASNSKWSIRLTKFIRCLWMLSKGGLGNRCRPEFLSCIKRAALESKRLSPDIRVRCSGETSHACLISRTHLTFLAAPSLSSSMPCFMSCRRRSCRRSSCI